MEQISEADIFGVIGEDGFRRLVSEFYRQIPTDDILGPMYPADEFEEAEYRLRGFLIGRFGGPQTYIEERGHPALRMRHAPYELTIEARNRWVEIMDKALNAAAFAPEVDQLLRPFFAQTATFLINRWE
ncbi:MAG: globin [Planctomycetota bacterium]|nr:globin [Planctomycetota bacterium]MDA1165666.1 globin [Planctomycetota bacterium]